MSLGEHTRFTLHTFPPSCPEHFFPFKNSQNEEKVTFKNSVFKLTNQTGVIEVQWNIQHCSTLLPPPLSNKKVLFIPFLKIKKNKNVCKQLQLRSLKSGSHSSSLPAKERPYYLFYFWEGGGTKRSWLITHINLNEFALLDSWHSRISILFTNCSWHFPLSWETYHAYKLPKTYLSLDLFYSWTFNRTGEAFAIKLWVGLFLIVNCGKKKFQLFQISIIKDPRSLKLQFCPPKCCNSDKSPTFKWTISKIVIWVTINWPHMHLIPLGFVYF